MENYTNGLSIKSSSCNLPCLMGWPWHKTTNTSVNSECKAVENERIDLIKVDQTWHKISNHLRTLVNCSKQKEES